MTDESIEEITPITSVSEKDVNIAYKPFDASNWPVFDSGLLGPVTLQAGGR